MRRDRTPPASIFPIRLSTNQAQQNGIDPTGVPGRGAVRRAASVVKRRFRAHEVLIREMTIEAPGIRFGRPLEDFCGVLTGQPDYTGHAVGLDVPK